MDFRLVYYTFSINLLLVFVGVLNSNAQTSELIISEYGEGSGNNKYIEIYNGTGSSVSLGDYQIGLITNGGSWTETIIALTTTTLNDGSTWVLANNLADATILAAADQTSSIFTVNGDDAIALQLVSGSVNLDLIGTDGADPGTGWDVAGTTNATANFTLVRKSTICDPQTIWATSAGTNTTDSEWIVNTIDDWADIGSHTISCAFGSTISAGPTGEPGTISSLVNTLGAASINFDFDYTDDALSPGYDALPTDITSITIDKGIGDDVSSWSDAILGAELSDGTNVLTAAVNTSTLVFSSIGVLGDINDDATKTFSLKVWLKSSMGGTLKESVDGNNLVFLIQNSGFTFGGSSSTLADSQEINSGASNNRVTVVATTLSVLSDATSTAPSSAMSPDVTFEAIDVNNNRDLDYSTGVNITSTGTLTGDPVAGSWSAGVATFSSLTHTVTGSSLVMTASSAGLTNGVTGTFDIVEPSIAITSNPIGIGEIKQWYIDEVLYAFSLAVTDASTTLTQFTCISAGTYIVSDFTSNSFKLRYSNDAVLDVGDATLGSIAIVSSGSNLIFSGLSQLIPKDVTGYFFVTADVDPSATINNTISITTTAFSNFIFDQGSKTGADPAVAGDEQTIASHTSAFIISEYGEGSSTNRYIELYNGTNGNLNLEDYQIGIILNGGAWNESTIALTPGVLAQDATWVLANPASDATILAAADQTDGLINFNGNDAISLQWVNGQVVLDLVGTDGADPGTAWDVAGTTNATKDKTLVRKSTVCLSETNWATSAGTTVGNSQWVVSPIDDWASIGTHSMPCSNGTSTLNAGGTTEPATFSSLVNTQVASSINFDFDFKDDGATPGTDAIATDITDIVIVQGTGNEVTTWSDAILGAELTDGTNTVSATVNAGNLTFSAIGILGDIADNDSKTYSLNVWLKTALGGSLPSDIDGKNLVFLVDNNSFTLDVTSSELKALQTVNSGASNNEVTVVAILLGINQNASNTTVNDVMNDVKFRAKDVNGNTDRDYSVACTISSTGSLNGDPVSGTWSFGRVTFSGLIHSATGNGLIMTASSGGLTNGVTSSFNITEPSVAINATVVNPEDIVVNSTDQILFQIDLSPTVDDATLTDITVTTAGTYITSDIVANSFKLRYSTDATLDGGDATLSTLAVVGSGSNLVFSGLSQLISNGATGYFFVTCDIAAGATSGNNINIANVPFSNIVFSVGAKTGGDPLASGGVKTIVSPSPGFIISEYAEGSSTNRYIELYNGSGSNLELIDYQIGMVVNGGSWNETTIALTPGTLVDGDTWVLAATTADASILAVADQTSSSLSFNGNDAVALQLITGQVNMDLIGEDGADPGIGWDVAGTTDGTKDYTLQRKSTICQGQTNWATSAGTNTGDSEWTVSAMDDWSGIGVHSMSCVTGTSTIDAGGTAEPSTVSSLVNSLGSASVNFDFDFTDDGATPGTDALATDITDMVFTQGSGNEVSDWTEGIAGAELSDGSNTSTAVVNSTNLTFNSLGVLGDISDDVTKTFTLKVWLKSSMGGSLPNDVDGKNLVFLINNAGFSFGGGSSVLLAGETLNSGSANNEIVVTASKLDLVTDASNTAVQVAMNPNVKFEANDANGNRDVNYNNATSLTSTGTMDGDPVSGSWSSGVATYSNLTHSVTGTGFVLTASSAGLSNSNTSTFDITEPSVAISETVVGSGNIEQGAVNQILYKINIAPTINDATLNDITVTTAGTYAIADLTASSFKLRYSTDATLDGGDATLSTKPIVSSGNNVAFTGLSQLISKDAIGYFFVTVDVDISATLSNTINVTPTAFSSINFSSGIKTGGDPLAAGGEQTIIAQTAANVYISEVSSKGFGADFNDEYIEISNSGGVSQDLSGWTLEYYNSSDVLEGGAIALSGSLSSNSTYLVAARSSHTGAISPDLVAGTFSMNSTCYIKLIDNVSALIDEAGATGDQFTSDINFELGNCNLDNKVVSNWDNLGTANGTPGTFNCCVAPTIQPSGISFTNITDTSMDINWSGNGNGDGRIAIMKATSAVTQNPVNSTAHVANTIFGSGDDLGGNEFVVYRASGGSVSVTGLSAGTTYHVAIHEYTSSGDCYLMTSPLIGSQSTTCTSPSDPSGYGATPGYSKVSLSWTLPGCYDEVMVVAKTSTITTSPTGDGSAYSSDSNFSGSGTSFNGTGKVVYKGSGTTVTITGVAIGTLHHFKIWTRKGTNWSAGSEVTDTPANNNVYYVNDASTAGDVYCTAVGNGANNGTFPSTPKASIQDVIDTYDLNEADTVYIDKGIYSEKITLGSADGGSVDYRVVFYGMGFNDSYISNTEETAKLSGVDYLEFVKLGFVSSTNASFNSFEALGCDYLTIQNCSLRISGTSGANLNCIDVSNLTTNNSDFFLMDNCEVSHNGFGDGISINGESDVNSGTGHIIRNNVITKTTAGTGDGLNQDQSDNLLFYNNRIVDFDNGIRNYGGLNSIFYNNYISSTGRGVECNGNSGTTAGGRFWFNSIYSGEDCFFYINANEHENWTLKNNILYTTSSATDDACIRINTGGGFDTCDYNLFYHPNGAEAGKVVSTTYTFANWQALDHSDEAALNGDENSLSGNPDYVNPGSSDLDLQAGSIAIGSGLDISTINTDIIGTSRPPIPSVGAYEGVVIIKRYWIADSGNWNNTANWSTTSGGAGGASVPVAGVDVYFDNNSFPSASYNITLDAGTWNCRKIFFQGVGRNVTLSGSGIMVFKD